MVTTSHPLAVRANPRRVTLNNGLWPCSKPMGVEDEALLRF